MMCIRKGALAAVTWEYVVFSPMIKNTCPNGGTPSGRPAGAEMAAGLAGLVGAKAPARPAMSASAGKKTLPVRTWHPRLPRGKNAAVARSPRNEHGQYLSL